MKNFLSFIALALALCTQLVAATPLQDRSIPPATLRELFAALGIQEHDVISQTQREWLRPSTQERWQQNELSAEKRQYVLSWAQKAGLFSPWTPSQSSYNKALILGATTPLMQTRLQYLKKLWDQGVRFGEIVWLTGERPLDRSVDGPSEGCQTESEAAKLVWQRADLPKAMRELSVTFITVPMKVVDGAWKRPNTEDTLIAWGRIASSPCSCLFVSDQPFCGYQSAVIEAALPDEFLFDVVGDGEENPTQHPAAAAITLDSLARTIYQTSLNTSKRSHTPAPVQKKPCPCGSKNL